MRPFADDVELTKRFKDGDLSAFEELVRKYQDKVYNLCRYMLHDSHNAQDAAQEVFLKAYSGFKDFRADSAFYSWLYRIAVNACLDQKRRSNQSSDSLGTTLSAEDLPSSGPSAERLYESKETGRLIDAALQRLPDKLKAAIVLKEIEELSYEQIAEVLDTSIGTVKSRISRAREELRRLLRENL